MYKKRSRPRFRVHFEQAHHKVWICWEKKPRPGFTFNLQRMLALTITVGRYFSYDIGSARIVYEFHTVKLLLLCKKRVWNDLQTWLHTLLDWKAKTANLFAFRVDEVKHAFRHPTSRNKSSYHQTSKGPVETLNMSVCQDVFPATII